METRPDRPHPSAVLTAKGVARQIRRMLPDGEPGIGEHTILDAIRRGELIAMPRKPGGWWRVRWGAVEAWLARRLPPPPSVSPTVASDAEAWAARRIADERASP